MHRRPHNRGRPHARHRATAHCRGDAAASHFRGACADAPEVGAQGSGPCRSAPPPSPHTHACARTCTHAHARGWAFSSAPMTCARSCGRMTSCRACRSRPSTWRGGLRARSSPPPEAGSEHRAERVEEARRDIGREVPRGRVHEDFAESELCCKYWLRWLLRLSPSSAVFCVLVCELCLASRRSLLVQHSARSGATQPGFGALLRCRLRPPLKDSPWASHLRSACRSRQCRRCKTGSPIKDVCVCGKLFAATHDLRESLHSKLC